MSRSNWLLSAAVLIGWGLSVAPAVAQQTPGAPGTNQVIPEKDRSRPVDQPNASGSASGPSLSDKLNRTDGVITPPANTDPEMHKPTPDTGTMPVIPPPGTSGSQRPNLDPK
jgi:hypothetical protein